MRITTEVRYVKIVATLGPASGDPGRIKELMEAGVDAIRLNFSHGSYEEHTSLFSTARQVAREMDKHVAVLQDLQGPKV